ncbi:MAG: Unknown protein [uncultured Thiotrichaceae bacterium]|uniref:CRISPR-associated protein n=1 Tax=uncultured Thiotrichaceae bacterium TaxID=298394 RepID=A0A6S6TYR5_9GAMM|nr:MAG: Unknown protein [uncultured Thiotrichaceae bacterium]
MNKLSSNNTIDSNELFGWSKQTWDFLDQWGILLGGFASLIAIVAFFLGMIALFKWERLRRHFTKNRFPNVQDTSDDHANWQGMLFTVSHEQTPLWVIDSCKPAYISLLATQKSRGATEKIMAHAEQQGLTVFDPIYIENPDNPAEVKRETKHLLQRMQAEGVERVAVDITGGKTPMSLGAFMAAEETLATTLYVSTKFDEQLKKPDMRTASLTTISDPQ